MTKGGRLLVAGAPTLTVWIYVLVMEQVNYLSHLNMNAAV